MVEKRVHYISYDRFPAPKGAAIHIAAFSHALAEAFGSLDLTTVCASHEQASPTGEAKPSQDCPRIRHRGLRIEGRNLIERVSCFRRQLMNDWRKTDIVHIRSIFEGYPIACNKEQHCHHLVYEVNGLPSVELKYHYPHVADDIELLTKLRHQEDACLSQADLVVTVSQVNAEYLRYRGVDPAKICVIPNGVDTSLFPFHRPQQNWQRMRMLYIGTLAAWQGVRVAVEALARYRREFPAELLIIGDGRNRQRKSLLELARKCGVEDFVELLPPQTQEQLVWHYRNSDCVVAPLLANDRNKVQGCCPLKVLEAMASGTPLLASDMAVVRALARDGQDALLFRPGSVKALKDAMVRLRSESGLAVRLAASARRRVKQHFQWRQAQQKLVQAYEEAFDMSRVNNAESSFSSR